MDSTGAPSELFVQFLRKYKTEFGGHSAFVHVNALIDCLQYGDRVGTIHPVLDLPDADFCFVLLLDCIRTTGTIGAACYPSHI
jgi:hypothetical protein